MDLINLSCGMVQVQTSTIYGDRHASVQSSSHRSHGLMRVVKLYKNVSLPGEAGQLKGY